jgi:hypothetical protein
MVPPPMPESMLQRTMTRPVPVVRKHHSTLRYLEDDRRTVTKAQPRKTVKKKYKKPRKKHKRKFKWTDLL